MRQIDMLKFGVTMNILRGRCFRVFGHKKLTELCENDIRMLSKLDKKKKTDIQKELDFMAGMVTCSDAAKILGIHKNTVGVAASKLHISALIFDNVRCYTEEEITRIKDFLMNGNKKTEKEIVNFEDIEIIPTFKNIDYDFLNKLSFFLEGKHAILKELKENIDPVNYKEYKSVFEILLVKTLESIPDGSKLKDMILNRFKLDNISFKPSSQIHESPINKNNFKSICDGVQYENKIPRHFINTIGMLVDVLKNFDKFNVVNSNFACLFSASLHILPEASRYKNNFYRKFNIVKRRAHRTYKNIAS